MNNIEQFVASLTCSVKERLVDLLDEQVHDIKADEAACINNQGVVVQADFIGLNAEGLAQLLAEDDAERVIEQQVTYDGIVAQCGVDSPEALGFRSLYPKVGVQATAAQRLTTHEWWV